MKTIDIHKNKMIFPVFFFIENISGGIVFVHQSAFMQFGGIFGQSGNQFFISALMSDRFYSLHLFADKI